MKASEYEQLVAEIVRSIVQAVDGALPGKLTSGKKSHVVGVSGYKHQIDVALSGHEATLLIECKYWSKRVSPAALLAFAARVIDIHASQSAPNISATMVTNRPPQPGAITLAKYFKIELMVVTSAQDFAFRYRDELRKGVPGLRLVASQGNPTIDVDDVEGKRSFRSA